MVFSPPPMPDGISSESRTTLVYEIKGFTQENADALHDRLVTVYDSDAKVRISLESGKLRIERKAISSRSVMEAHVSLVTRLIKEIAPQATCRRTYP